MTAGYRLPLRYRATFAIAGGHAAGLRRRRSRRLVGDTFLVGDRHRRCGRPPWLVSCAGEGSAPTAIGPRARRAAAAVPAEWLRNHRRVRSDHRSRERERARRNCPRLFRRAAVLARLLKRESPPVTAETVCALAFALMLGCLSFGLSYLVGGRAVATASLIVAPILLMPIALQVARRLREHDSEQELPGLGDRRHKLILASLAFVVAGGLGAIGLDVPGHSNAGWLYIVILVTGALWAILAALVVSR